MLEKIWSHGLQSKQGKSALWNHLLAYLELLEARQAAGSGDTNNSPNLNSRPNSPKTSNSGNKVGISSSYAVAAPALAWNVMRKRMDCKCIYKNKSLSFS